MRTTTTGRAAPPRLLFLIVLISSAAAVAQAAAASPVLAQMALSECPAKCGEVDVPYPFGIREGCSLNRRFLLECNTTLEPPELLLGNIHIQEISLEKGLVRVTLFIGRDCYDQQGEKLNRGNMSTNVTGSPFSISADHNKFVAIGCDTLAYYVASTADGYASGCASICRDEDSVTNGTCSGIGCCETAIPRGLQYFEADIRSYHNHTRVWRFNPCSYAFVVDVDRFTFFRANVSANYAYELVKLPAVFDWAIQDSSTTCKNGMPCDRGSSACRSDNSGWRPSNDGRGYLCACSPGYQGNPYLSRGCQDINECNHTNTYPCHGVCTNTMGGYNCTCPEGTRGNATERACTPDPRLDGDRGGLPLYLKLISGIGSSILILLVITSWTYWGLQKRKMIKLKQRFYEQNGGFLLQQQISSHRGATFRIFTIGEIERATNNFDKSYILGHGGHGTVYKGTLDDHRAVAIKKSKMIDESQNREFAKEIFILSQINHRNVVKLLGCCLEVEVPILVYEFISNGTLFHHIHSRTHPCSSPIHVRLRIAAEAAEALSYLHSYASPPIIHGDVKSLNILLDHDYVAKVSDFGASTLIPKDKSQFTTIVQVQGTCGYLDPEYLQTCLLTEKSDVYSFGVVLAEFLTEKKALYSEGSEEERSLALSFVSAVRENKLSHIIDVQLLEQKGITPELRQVSELAMQCLCLKGDERPTMKEVAMVLQGLSMTENHPWVKYNPEERESLLGDPPTYYTSDSPGPGQRSLASHTTLNIETGR